ncbi:hypothetical protein CkaCkLH20_05703 [Colletotrichum karsti]|uniref:2EXR domain-containing protein n=1 Tax=Colletotrichum karsti TaxID=1095194 RepID=A0A9P6LLR5_9PEZI|nr:uncharacterized protein CkaCkLH20_05703 [Colletotrichum karsti]KAF9876857.1 hypothetical protein CkaCkLH20_05703 [Colletotrichum karsti]
MISTRWTSRKWSQYAMPRWSRSCKKKEPGRVAYSPVATRSALLCLPRELRDMIYEYTNLLPCKQLLRTQFSMPNGNENKLWSCEACDNLAPHCYCYRPPLLLVCSQIRDEALDFLFARNLFQLPADGLGLLIQYLSNLAQIHRRIKGPIRPPKDLRSLWAEFLGRVRYLCISLDKDLLDSPTLVSSALQNSPRLTEIVLSKHHGLDAQRPLEGLLVELAKIPSLTSIKLAKGFEAGDDDVVSRITGLPAQLICWCNYGEPWGPKLWNPLRSFSVGSISFAMLGCYITDNLDGPMTEWHVPHLAKKHTRHWDNRIDPGHYTAQDLLAKEIRRRPSLHCFKE